MNAVTNPAREQYKPIVQTFLPGCEGEELELRAALLLMRDRAIAVKPIACEESFAILDLIERTASRDAFRPMAFEELTRLRYILLKLVGCSSDFDAMWARTYPETGDGESDARG